MLEKLRFFRMELSSLRTMTQAGGKLSPELHKKFAEYAEKKQASASLSCTVRPKRPQEWHTLPHKDALSKVGSMGIAIPGGKFKLIDADGKEITEPDTVGELVYEGANVTLGYAEGGSDLIKSDEEMVSFKPETWRNGTRTVFTTL
jgi:acyl-CoA synthetase (AMP-forming)/AMP-acid ligase II